MRQQLNTEDIPRIFDVLEDSDVFWQGISDHQQNWGYEDGPWKGPRPPLLVVADF